MYWFSGKRTWFWVLCFVRDLWRFDQTVTVFRLLFSYRKHVYIIRKSCKPQHHITHVTLNPFWMGGECQVAPTLMPAFPAEHLM